ncbi:GRIP and coiled-coil domain-containing protein-like isoform X2 [Diabrotica virgifera virgifera]|uniref:SHSP domain-containing protein n=1 Tax=Diabrotica virgifera virgifera TaxID=50390 RepID=A0ABM5KMQ3_DIAVI|nr:GRIP and coiled-coil domain-containing protein-like isoform X2 [Diabrotica virgifera virgifera]
MDIFPNLFQDNFWAPNCPGRGADSGNLVQNITDVLNSIAIAKAMFCPEYDINNQDVNGNSEVPQPSTSATTDKTNFEANPGDNFKEDILNSIAIAKAMFCPEYDNNQDVNDNSEVPQPSSSARTDKTNFEANPGDDFKEDILNSIAIAKAMFCPEYDNSHDVSSNSEVPQPSTSAMTDKTNFEANSGESIKEVILNSIEIAKAMFCPENDNNNQDVSGNSDMPQPSTSAMTDKPNFEANAVDNIKEDILNSIAIAKAMFCPEYDNSNQCVSGNSEVPQHSSSSTTEKTNFEANLEDNVKEGILNSIAIAKAMFCPEYDGNNQYVNGNSEVPQPSSSATTDKTNFKGNPVDSIKEDILNSIAIAKAMFCPEYDNNNQDVNTNSEVQQHRSSVTSDKNKFQANCDVQHFKPEEITIKVNNDKSITIEAKHEEKPDEHGTIYRHFVRKYVLPENCDIDRVESRLSIDGVLTITAPIVTENAVEHRTIPIIRTGELVRPQQNLAHERKEQVEDKDVIES